MVFDHIVSTKDYNEILLYAAALHDIEKRSTTVHEPDGSITSKGHAKRGEFTARSLIYRRNLLDFRDREQVAKLVRYHGLPLWIMEKSDPTRAAIKVASEVDILSLSDLCEADIYGRICDDQEELDFRRALFCELLSETLVMRCPPDNLSTFEYFERERTDSTYQAYDNSWGTVYMMSGLPGTGKDTYIANQLHSLPVISLDDIRRSNRLDPADKTDTSKAVSIAKELAKTYLRAKKPFVWNGTNLTRQNRQQLISLFTTYEAKVNLIYLEVPYKQLITQNRNREHVVPDNVLDRMIERLEMPQVWEAPQVDYIIQ